MTMGFFDGMSRKDLRKVVSYFEEVDKAGGTPYRRCNHCSGEYRLDAIEDGLCPSCWDRKQCPEEFAGGEGE